MDLTLARFLTSARGQRALEAARDSRDVPAHRRATYLADLGSSEEVRAALQQDDLRARAADRLPQSEDLLFTATSVQQATAWIVAKERARRWPDPRDTLLTDIGAGIGIDALAAALYGRPVRAIERDPVRAHFLAWNAEALQVAKLVTVVAEDADELALEGEQAFLDPDRRPDGRRTRDAALFEPPAERWNALLGPFPRALMKLPPGQDPRQEDTPFPDAPMEVVSLSGRARERRLYIGDWPARARRSALSLPRGARLEGEGVAWPDAHGVGEGDWLLDPDVSVTLAGLVGDLAVRDALAPIHPQIPYLRAATPTAGAPGHWMRVDAVLPAKRKALDAWLAAYEIGQLTLRKRGVEEKVETWRKKLKPKGPNAGTLVFTRDLKDRWIALACLDAEAGRFGGVDPAE